MVVSPRTLLKAREDFRVFLLLIWRHLGLPSPTPVQYQIAEWLQHGPRRKVIMAFRGIGKSWITSAFVLWLLWNDPELKILVVSASKDRSDAFSIFTKRLLGEVEFLRHLRPDARKGDRDSNVAFDIRGCKPAHAPSVKSVGITGQIAGSRADYIVGDDVEVPNNSETATQREKLLVRVAELGGAVLTPESKAAGKGGVTFLGTPQVEDSLYNHLAEKGYTLRVWPARFPEEPAKYHGNLSPNLLQQLDEANANPGEPVDPDRFNEIELVERAVEYGKIGFALQFMLDTSLADADRHPLKLADLIVMDVDRKVAPDFVVWAGGDENVLEHLPRCGLPGDRFHKPMKLAEKFSPFSGSILYVDPSGRGRDQTAYAVLKMLNGLLYLRRWGAMEGGYEAPTLTKLAEIAADEKVNEVVIEDNFGDGMFAQLFRPVLRKVYKTVTGGDGCAVTDDHVTGQKEKRAIEAIEPVLASHRLVVDTQVVKDALRSKERMGDADAALKTGFYQLTRLTPERGCLKYDDWIDALSGAVRYYTKRMAQDMDEQADERKKERLDKELQKFEEGMFGTSNQPRAWHDRVC
jgi:hypothetical protein